MSTQRLALLALALLALASPAAADCTQGSITLDLLSYTGPSCEANPIALCLSSFKVLIATSCDMQVEPLLAGGSYAPGIWSSNPTATYTRLMACPTWARAAVTPSGADPADRRAAIEQAIEQAIYGSSYALAVTSTWGTGTVTLTAGTCSFKYAVTSVSDGSDGTAYVSQVDAGAKRAVCDLGTENAAKLSTTADECQAVSTPCAAGKRTVALDGANACALCQAGSYSTAGSSATCTACGTGKFAKKVGANAADQCLSCAAGTYSAGGLSECQPCSPGTYTNATGQTTCDACPASSYSPLPGGTSCMRCVAGIAKCVAGSGLGYTCDTSNTDAPTAGYQVVSVKTATTLGSACTLTGDISYGNVALFGQCSGISTPGSTYLSVYVDQYCNVQITPIKDITCSEPGAAYWSSVRMRGSYVTPTSIGNMLNTAVTNLTSSYLFTIKPATGNDLTLNYWPATTDTSYAAVTTAAITKVCAGTVEVIGGQVDGVPGTAASCPAGTFNLPSLDDGCRPCPVGNTCAADATAPTECAADQFQSYLGQTACLECSTTSPRKTSAAGSDYCTLTYVNTSCANGKEWSADSSTCVDCEAGTYRTSGRDASCLLCPPGTYSAAGAADCTPCPLDQFSPVTGLGNVTDGAQKCYYCPVGSVAKNANDAVGQTGSITCTVCPPGTISAFASGETWNSCVACDDGYFRSGDATNSNNVCNKIPAGYKEKARSTTLYDRAELVLCTFGEISSWTGNVRTPTNPENCQPCAGDNTYAPREGMTKCQPCPGGTYPSKSSPGLPGNDACSPCTGNTYRSFESTSPVCLVCTAGRETFVTGNTQCVPCDAGYFNPDAQGNADTGQPAQDGACEACPINKYQPNTGQGSCLQCGAGSSTQGEGNTECQPCPLGYYSPSGDTECLPAPAGSFVGSIGATTFTPCPTGTFGNNTAAYFCAVCGPGQYSNTLGAKTCKTCQAGTFSGANSTNCRTCQPGFYSMAGSSSCSPCRPGTFASGFGSSTCAQCSAGSQCPSPSMKSAQSCPRGTFSSGPGKRICDECAVDTYQSEIGQRGCLACPAGTDTRGLTGQSACQPKRPGLRKLLRTFGFSQ